MILHLSCLYLLLLAVNINKYKTHIWVKTGCFPEMLRNFEKGQKRKFWMIFGFDQHPCCTVCGEFCWCHHVIPWSSHHVISTLFPFKTVYYWLLVYIKILCFSMSNHFETSETIWTCYRKFPLNFVVTYMATHADLS